MTEERKLEKLKLMTPEILCNGIINLTEHNLESYENNRILGNIINILKSDSIKIFEPFADNYKSFDEWFDNTITYKNLDYLSECTDNPYVGTLISSILNHSYFNSYFKERVLFVLKMYNVDYVCNEFKYPFNDVMLDIKDIDLDLFSLLDKRLNRNIELDTLTRLLDKPRYDIVKDLVYDENIITKHKEYFNILNLSHGHSKTSIVNWFNVYVDIQNKNFVKQYVDIHWKNVIQNRIDNFLKK